MSKTANNNGNVQEITEGKVRIIHFDDRTEYRLGEKLHRYNDKPAIEMNDGTKIWYNYGHLVKIQFPSGKVRQFNP